MHTRLIERLVSQLRSPHVGGATWMAAGEVLARALVAGDRREVVEHLADALVGSLLWVQDRTMDEATPEERVKLALAAVATSVARPRAVGACDAAISTWVGWTAGPPRQLADPELLASRVLLALLLGDVEQAAEAVDVLIERQPHGPGLLLHDWIVAVLQDHGVRRQVQAFHHLRAALRQEGRDRSALSLTAAAVLMNAAGLPRQRVTGWLHEVASAVEVDGTARCTPVPAASRVR